MKHIICAIALVTAVALPSLPVAQEVKVFAAASLEGPLDEIAREWEAETAGTVAIAYGGSRELARQIMQGERADIFISTAGPPVTILQMQGLVTARADLLGNRLVLVEHGAELAPVDLADLPDLLGDDLLSMALVDDTLAGEYGKEALVNLGLWNKLSRSIIQSPDARIALGYVARGEAPFGIVYATDFAQADNVTVVATFPPATHRPIIYTAALLAGATNPAPAAFFDALSSDSADAIFARAGFAVLD